MSSYLKKIGKIAAASDKTPEGRVLMLVTRELIKCFNGTYSLEKEAFPFKEDDIFVEKIPYRLLRKTTRKTLRFLAKADSDRVKWFTQDALFHYETNYYDTGTVLIPEGWKTDATKLTLEQIIDLVAYNIF